MHRLVVLSIGALVFCFLVPAQAGWNGPTGSSFALETVTPVISIKDNKKHHDGKNKKAKNKKHKDHDDDDGEQANTNSGSKPSNEAEAYQDTLEKAEGRYTNF
jgi:hypothetical protein